MRAVIQKVTKASVTVGGDIVILFFCFLFEVYMGNSFIIVCY